MKFLWIILKDSDIWLFWPVYDLTDVSIAFGIVFPTETLSNGSNIQIFSTGMLYLDLFVSLGVIVDCSILHFFNLNV